MKVSLFHLLSQFQYVEPILCGLLLYLLVRAKAARQFAYLCGLLGVRLLCDVICIPLLNFSGRGIERHLAYQVYFYVYWTSFALEAILSLLVIYGIFKMAMAPLKGLQTLGMLVFRWVAAISGCGCDRCCGLSPSVGDQVYDCHDHPASTDIEHSDSLPAVVCVLRHPADGSVVPQPHLRHKPWTWLSGNDQPGQLLHGWPGMSACTPRSAWSTVWQSV